MQNSRLIGIHVQTLKSIKICIFFFSCFFCHSFVLIISYFNSFTLSSHSKWLDIEKLKNALAREHSFGRRNNVIYVCVSHRWSMPRICVCLTLPSMRIRCIRWFNAQLHTNNFPIAVRL